MFLLQEKSRHCWIYIKFMNIMLSEQVNNLIKLLTYLKCCCICRIVQESPINCESENLGMCVHCDSNIDNILCH
jgi:hypothetical protein